MNRWPLDLALIALCLLASAVIVYQQAQLTASRHRENEMFVLANRLDKAAHDWKGTSETWERAALSFERTALSCLGTVKQYRLFFDQTTSPMVQPLQPLNAVEAPR